MMCCSGVSLLGLRLGLEFGGLGLGLECCGHGLAGQVLALALADAVKLRYINSNILLLGLTMIVITE